MTEPRIIVVGAGVAGITTAHVLRESGFTDVSVLEKGSDVGGGWHWNRYPGLSCDVPSQIYQFGFRAQGRLAATLSQRQRHSAVPPRCRRPAGPGSTRRTRYRSDASTLERR